MAATSSLNSSEPIDSLVATLSDFASSEQTALGALPMHGNWPGFSAETVGDVDLLGFEGEARSLAAVLVDARLCPPMTLGIFGEWGSGKSFFMSLLRKEIGKLATSSRQHVRIVRVTFNAWQYVQANVWSALFYQVLEAVTIALSDGGSEQGWEQLAAQLETGFEVRQRLRQEREALQQEGSELDRRLEEVSQRRGELAEAIDTGELESRINKQRLRQTITRLLGTGDLPSVARLTRLEETRVQDLLSWNVVPVWWIALGIALVLSFLAFVGSQVLEVKHLTTLQRQIWLCLECSPAALVYVMPALAFFKLRAVRRIGHQARAHSLSEEKRRNSLGSVDEAMRLVQSQKARIDNAMADIDRRLAQAVSSRSLVEYVQQQLQESQSQTYLGLLGKLRRDFETVSLALQNRADPLRVVIYVDDLDRCPASKVVETLEAIHLLFGFPSFVVVLAADARWLTRSLERQYSGQLSDPLDVGASIDRKSLGNAATSFDYLEKIVQIPLWLARLDRTKIRGFIEHHLRDDAHGSTGPGLAENEIESLSSLGGLLGENPRTVKRFLNTYRMVRSSLAPQELASLLGSPTSPAGYEALGLFMALAVGQAALTRVLAEHLRKSSNRLTVAEWLNSLDSTLRGEELTRVPWESHEETIRRSLSRYGLEQSLLDVNRLAQIAQRYSFLQR